MKLRARILVVDDDPMNLSVMQEVLGDDYHLKTLSSGKGVLKEARAFRPDLVLLDIMMPEVSGYDVCRQLRAQHGLRHLKIVLVSAKAMLSERLEGYRAGADDYITKPFDIDELAAKVRIYVRLKSVEEVEELKGSFLNLLSHETRTPLTGILAPAELLESDKAVDTPTRRKLAGMILSSAARLQQLFEKVTMLSNLRMGDAELNWATTDAATVLRRAADSAKERLSRRGITIHLDDPGCAEIVTDSGHLEVALSALLDNAVRFSPDGGRIDLTLDDGDESLTLSVIDHGRGIDPAFLPRVFDELTVEDPDHHSGGPGLSLALSRAIVEALGGEIRVASTPGVETRFVIQLPKALHMPLAA